MQDHEIIRNHSMFRVILSATSHPGKVYKLPEFSSEELAAVELLGCLIDRDVNVAVLGNSQLAEALARHTDCRLVTPANADFIIVDNGKSTENIESIKRGTMEYPEGGATLVYLVDAIKENEGGPTLSGPGINGSISICISGLANGELRQLQRLNNGFPLGVDAIFLVPRRSGRIACIPRSTTIGV